MNEVTIVCARCGEDATHGLAYNFQGPATGHNKERGVLCPDCVVALRWFLNPRHVHASDPVTAAGLAHISVCLECNNRFHGADYGATLTNHLRAAERFNEGGYAQ